MKTITLLADNRFQHFWPDSDKEENPAPLPTGGVVVEDSIAMDLFNNPYTRAYDLINSVVIDYIKPLSIAKSDAIEAMKYERNKSIVLPVSSSALGLGAKTYGSTPLDRQNITDQVVLGAGGFLSNNEDGRGAHTDAQLRAVGADMAISIDAFHSRYATKKAEINAAITVAEVNAVAWE